VHFPSGLPSPLRLRGDFPSFSCEINQTLLYSANEFMKTKAANRSVPTQRRARTDSRVPLNLLVPEALKEQLARKAKETGMSINELANLLLDQEELEKQIKRLVSQKLDQQYRPQLGLLEQTAINIEETNQMLKRILENPFDLLTLFKKPKEKIRN
jgi:hypothetical protein